MHRRKLITPVLVAASAVGLAVATATPASAHTNAPFSLKGLTTRHAAAATASASITTLTDQVFGPFNLEIRDGKVLVADGFLGAIERINPGGGLSTVASATFPGGDVAGVASGGGALAWTGGDGQNGHQTLTVRRPGHADQVVDISGFENAKNPDKVSFYGVHNASSCVRKALRREQLGIAYHGVLDSHAYSVAYDGNNGWYVADAAGNDLLWVSPSGNVRLVAVIPPQPITFTAQSAAQAGLPSCFAGVTYNFEPVPTDVELSGGKLYVSLLPGGPEDPSFGARGSVWSLNQNGTGLTKLAGGLAGATNVAVGGGHVYVSQLFAGEVSMVKNGGTVPVASLPGPIGLEYHDGALYAGVIAQTDEMGNVTAPGSVVRIDLS